MTVVAVVVSIAMIRSNSSTRAAAVNIPLSLASFAGLPGLVLLIIGSVRTWKRELVSDACRATTLWARNNGLYLGIWIAVAAACFLVTVIACCVFCCAIATSSSMQSRTERPDGYTAVPQTYQ
jgi:hypothetical protein